MRDNPFTVLEDEFVLLDTIGRGGFAKVKLAIHIRTEEKVAIKIMEKSKLGHDLPRVKREIAALKVLDHPNVCRLLQCIETETHIFMVLEYCQGGELFDYIVERDRLSENEARRFFRQIVSAIAYVHSKGYAHRDLKPENLLLDDKQRIKVIDFGLCARPQGGMSEHLETCCGSPAYAAPELVSGKSYLGSEADVWSMGVLLYALLCGFLPFDDQNVLHLYKKIMRGYYTKPGFLSTESRMLISSMLQVIPNRRISVQELCKHPWITKRYGKNVIWNQANTRETLDPDCLNALALLRGVNASKLAEELREWKYDSDTAMYMLLQQRKKRGLPLVTLAHRSNGSPITNIHVSMEGGLDNSELLSFCSKDCTVDVGLIRSKAKVNYEPVQAVEDANEVPTTPKAASKTVVAVPKLSDGPSGDASAIPSTSHNKENEEGKFAYPNVPTPRKHRRIRSPKLATSWNADSAMSSKDADMQSKLSPARSVDEGLQAVTPGRSNWENSGTSGTGTPLSARRMLGSLERGLHRMRNMLHLTPLRRRQENRPIVLNSKGVCNVSTTASTSPDLVLNELLKALNNKGIICKQSGFLVQGKVKDDNNKTKLSFELEVCVIGPTMCVGIRRKRLRGDAWCYKRVCEEILALTALQMPTPPNPPAMFTVVGKKVDASKCSRQVTNTPCQSDGIRQNNRKNVVTTGKSAN